MTKPSTRTILALALAAVLVLVAAVAGIVAVAVHNAHEADPAVTAYAHGQTVTVPPYRYWTIERSEANGQLELKRPPESETTVSLPTPPGYPVQLSLPRHISDAPWVMVLEYRTPDGTAVQHLASYRNYAAGTRAVTVPSRPEPDLRLVGIEIQLIIPTRDDLGNESFMPYQAWSVRTA